MIPLYIYGFYVDVYKRQYQGFDLELIKAIGDKLGLDVEYVNNDFDTLVPGVASGAKYDVSKMCIRDRFPGDARSDHHEYVR